MSANQHQNDNWHDCPAGELSQMVGRVNTSQRQARRKQLFGTAAACMLLVAVGVFSVGSVFAPNGDFTFGGITCTECHENFAAFERYQTEAATMNQALALSMETHLEQCPRCGKAFEKTYPGILSSELSNQPTMPLLAIASFATLY